VIGASAKAITPQQAGALGGAFSPVEQLYKLSLRGHSVAVLNLVQFYKRLKAIDGITSREIRRLYDHCRQSPATVTERIAADPAGFLNALAAARTGMDLDLSPAENKCLDQLRLIGNLSLALARRLPEVWAAPDKLRQAFATCRERFTWLEKTIGGVHAGS